MHDEKPANHKQQQVLCFTDSFDSLLTCQVLQRGQELSKREWKVVRVAIVDMTNKTYIGRLFFGDKETGETVWDIDCRPSDGIWLSLKVRQAPLSLFPFGKNCKACDFLPKFISFVANMPIER